MHSIGLTHWVWCCSIRCVRTTLDIDDDVLRAVKEIADRENSSAGRVISSLARKALSTRAKSPKLRNGIPVLPSRGDVISLDHVRKLLDQENV